MAENNDQAVFFVDGDLVERLMRGDSATGPGKGKRPAASPTLAQAVTLASEGHVDDAIRALEGAAARVFTARMESAPRCGAASRLFRS